MYQASLAMRISVSFSRLLLNWVATYRHDMRVIIPNSSSVRYIWLNDDSQTATDSEKKINVFVSVVTLQHIMCLFFMCVVNVWGSWVLEREQMM